MIQIFPENNIENEENHTEIILNASRRSWVPPILSLLTSVEIETGGVHYLPEGSSGLISGS